MAAILACAPDAAGPADGKKSSARTRLSRFALQQNRSPGTRTIGTSPCRTTPMHRPAPRFIENRTFDEIAIGDHAELSRTLRPQDIQLFAVMSGDVNPTHVDAEYARSGQFREIIGHSMWGSSLISAVLGTEFPGPGTVYIAQNLRFLRPLVVGDTLTVHLTCREKFPRDHHIVFDCRALNQEGSVV